MRDRAPGADGPGETVHAVVQVGDAVTGYVRMGRGRTVVLVRDGGGRAPPSDPLVERLSELFRVIAPVGPDPDAADACGWLRGIIEGLGLDRPDLVVVGGGPWVDRFLALHRVHVGRAIVVPRAADRAALAERIAALLGSGD